jgi:hypothetical protein
LRRSPLSSRPSIIPSTATSCFACALAMARMARCTEVTGIPVPVAMTEARLHKVSNHQAPSRAFSPRSGTRTGFLGGRALRNTLDRGTGPCRPVRV